MRKFFKSTLWFKIWTGSITLMILAWVFTRPDIYHPFSKHTAWDRGFQEATGMWPEEWNVAYPRNPVNQGMREVMSFPNEEKMH